MLALVFTFLDSLAQSDEGGSEEDNGHENENNCVWEGSVY